MNIEIYIPDPLYKMLPFLCFLSATVAMFTDPNVIKTSCIIILYCYSIYIFIIRAINKNYKEYHARII